jgi:hypothetical protein
MHGDHVKSASTHAKTLKDGPLGRGSFAAVGNIESKNALRAARPLYRVFSDRERAFFP